MTALNHADLERYLLGTLPDEVRDRIDERLLIDSEIFEALCVVENELAYDYALGMLTADERRQFEQRFLERPAVKERVRTAAALIDSRQTAEPPRQDRPWWLYAAAAASVLLIAWLARDNARLRQTTAPERQSASIPAAPSASAATPAPNTLLGAPSAAPSAAVDRSASIVAVTLQPGLVRSSATPSRIRLRAGDTVRLELVLPDASKAPVSYRASIRNPDDVEQWVGTAVVSPSSRTATFTVPAVSLPANDYEVTLFGVRADGSREELASYSLSITKQ